MTGTENTSANTGENTGTPERNPGELSGAYALNAVEARERAAFEAHLESSEQARIESAELSDTAVALGLATAPVLPSAALKASLMAKLSSTPQLAPLAGPASTPAADAAPGALRLAKVPPVPPSPPATPLVAADPSVAGTDTDTRSGSGTSAAERARKRWFQRPASLLLTAAAAVALFVGGTFVGLGLAGPSGTSDSFAAQQAASLARLNAAPDVQRASATTADGHQATLVWSDTSSLSALVVDGLPMLSGDKDYQLWYIGAGGAVSAGLLDTSVNASGGTAWRVLDGSLSTGDTIGVTVEPKGGSKQPTTTPIVAIQSS